ncbi:aspartate/glutamate racemase family protein [Chloroflexota bacterium]
MKTIGLIGGMSWESSIEYYRIINQVTREKLGGLHSARSVMVSVDFAEIEELQDGGQWEEATEMMVATAQQVERGGADLILICTNTMHKMAPEVQAAINVPLLHIADATGQKIKAQGLETVGLLGTRFTMEENFYKGRLERLHGLEVLTPDSEQREMINQVIYTELVVGEKLPESKAAFVEVLDSLVAAGAEGIVLGCTEIPLLVGQGDTNVPVFDTTFIHASTAVEIALGLSPLP